MTREQYNAIGDLKIRGYSVRRLMPTAYGIVRATVRRKLRTGYLTLCVYPNGTYVGSEYDTRTIRKGSHPSWQN